MPPRDRYLAQFTGLAHRGGGDERFENSIAAFTHAVSLGYDVIETDIQVSRDGTIYIFHDDDLDRTTTGHGAFHDKTDAELSQITLNNGEPIPTLSQMLEAVSGVILNIDVKADSGIRPIADYLNTHQCHDRICLAGFSTKRMTAIRQLLHKPCSFSGGQADILRLYLGSFGLPMGRPDIIAAQVPVKAFGLNVVTPRFIRHCRRLGIAVHVWTIDDAHEMQRLIDMGVDGIVTDNPTRLKEVAAQNNLTIAP